MFGESGKEGGLSPMESFHSCGNSYLLKQARIVCHLFFPVFHGNSTANSRSAWTLTGLLLEEASSASVMDLLFVERLLILVSWRMLLWLPVSSAI